MKIAVLGVGHIGSTAGRLWHAAGHEVTFAARDAAEPRALADDMAQPAVPDSAGWQRRWTVEAGSVTLRPVTRRIARAVLDGGPITRKFEKGALHDRIPQAMGLAIRDIDSGAAAMLPTRLAGGPPR